MAVEASMFLSAFAAVSFNAKFCLLIFFLFAYSFALQIGFTLIIPLSALKLTDMQMFCFCWITSMFAVNSKHVYIWMCVCVCGRFNI